MAKPKPNEHYIAYIDDSGDGSCSIFSALLIPASMWRDSFAVLKEYRKQLRQSDQILLRVEFHATDFVSGHGRLGPKIVTKFRRCQIFDEVLAKVASLPGARLINACLGPNRHDWAFERLLNRINRTMQAWGASALLICDQGKESFYTKLARRMAVFNRIPSRYGKWSDTGGSTKNIPLDRIIEDPIFRVSASSYFVQAVDFSAYALLRREHPLPSKNKYGLDKSFNRLTTICVTEANSRDIHGVIR